jgi:hypothetical protein
MELVHNIQSIRFIKEEMIIQVDNHLYTINLKQVSSRLLNASEEQRNSYVVSPSNYGINWPLIDEDLSIHNLISEATLLK